MGKRKIALTFSAVLIIMSFVSLATNGLNFGIDFTGGFLIEAGYEHDVDIEPIRSILSQNGYQDALVQHFVKVCCFVQVHSEHRSKLSKNVR